MKDNGEDQQMQPKDEPTKTNAEQKIDMESKAGSDQKKNENLGKIEDEEMKSYCKSVRLYTLPVNEC